MFLYSLDDTSIWYKQHDTHILTIAAFLLKTGLFQLCLHSSDTIIFIY